MNPKFEPSQRVLIVPFGRVGTISRVTIEHDYFEHISSHSGMHVVDKILRDTRITYTVEWYDETREEYCATDVDERDLVAQPELPFTEEAVFDVEIKKPKKAAVIEWLKKK